jgi:hypothetical protein
MRDGTPSGPLLFLSHAGADTGAARVLKQRIEQAPEARKRGLKVWFDKDNLRAGEPWQKQLEDTLGQQATAFAVYVGSRGVINWVEAEVRLGLSRAIGSLITAGSRSSSSSPPFSSSSSSSSSLGSRGGTAAWTRLRHEKLLSVKPRVILAPPDGEDIYRQSLARSRPDSDTWAGSVGGPGHPCAYRARWLGFGPSGNQKMHLEKRTCHAHRHRVSHLAGAREQAWSGEKPQRLDGCSLRRSGVCRRPDHRQPHQAAAHKVQGKRRRVRYDRDALWCRLSLQGSMSVPLFRASSGLLSQSSRRRRPNTEVTARSPCGRRGVLAAGRFP